VDLVFDDVRHVERYTPRGLDGSRQHEADGSSKNNTGIVETVLVCEPSELAEIDDDTGCGADVGDRAAKRGRDGVFDDTSACPHAHLAEHGTHEIARLESGARCKDAGQRAKLVRAGTAFDERAP